MIAFYEKYLLLNTKDYFPDGMDFYINICLLCISVALCAVSFLLNYYKMSSSLVLKRLLRREAVGQDKAQTLTSLGLKRSLGVRTALYGRGKLHGVILCADKKSYTYEEYRALQKQKGFKDEKIDFNTAKFYLSPESIDKAKVIADRDSSGLLTPVLSCVLIIALFVCISLLMPEILRFISNVEIK